MRLSRTTLMAVCVMSLVMLTPAMATTYTGSLSSSDGGLMGIGAWVDSGVSQITWEITQNNDSSWHYEYSLVVPNTAHEIGHFILETSSTFTEDDVFNESGAFECIEIKSHLATSPGSPELPLDVFGIKFDSTFGRLLSITFDSFRDPVWGDFYAKGGGQVSQQVWNTGLTYVDPLTAAADGSLNNHILVPDTVPEPASLLMISLGALIVRGKFRRTKKTA